jgi:GGDEF domain-containing protein
LEGDPEAGRLFPTTVHQYALYDQWFFEVLAGVLSALRVALDLGDDRVLRFLLLDYHRSEEEVRILLGDSAESLSEEEEQERGGEREGLECDLDVAREMLAWRAFRLAHFIGALMIDYEFTHPSGREIWHDWRRMVRSQAPSGLIAKMTDEEFALAMMSRDAHRLLDLKYEYPLTVLTIPSDSDLRPVPGAMWVEYPDAVSDWEELLGTPPEGVNCGNLLRAAYLAAKQSWQAGQIREVAKADQVVEQLREMKHLVEESMAWQSPVMDLLDRVAKNTDRPSRFQAEERLKSLLGSVYGQLCRDAQFCLIKAEQFWEHFGHEACDEVVLNLAKALESQLKCVVLDGLVGPLGVRQFVVDVPQEPGRPVVLVQNGRVNRANLTLGGIRKAFEHAPPELESFCQEWGIRPASVIEALKEVTDLRNPAAHDRSITPNQMEQARKDWLGAETHDGGIFQFVVSERLSAAVQPRWRRLPGTA